VSSSALIRSSSMDGCSQRAGAGGDGAVGTWQWQLARRDEQREEPRLTSGRRGSAEGALAQLELACCWAFGGASVGHRCGCRQLRGAAEWGGGFGSRAHRLLSDIDACRQLEQQRVHTAICHVAQLVCVGVRCADQPVHIGNACVCAGCSSVRRRLRSFSGGSFRRFHASRVRRAVGCTVVCL
jgi:hypothetical protein